ncbi:IS66 family insertion sequence element accessory protein TnpA [Vibrio sp. 10N.261.51.A4]|uniref:IS66 family insertion sequence element accessory protein TnpA n=1 Tax=Vibrio sp. 10N.261.51.A4 TaxID=3229674 RepID=UPI0035526E37
MTSRRTLDDWQTIIDQYQASGLKASEFCRQNNITASNFYVWRKKLLGESSLEQNLDSSSHADADTWQLISPPQREQSWDIELSLPGGVTLRMRHS